MGCVTELTAASEECLHVCASTCASVCAYVYVHVCVCVCTYHLQKDGKLHVGSTMHLMRALQLHIISCTCTMCLSSPSNHSGMLRTWAPSNFWNVYVNRSKWWLLIVYQGVAIDNIDSITGIGNLSCDQYTAIHSMADSPCWSVMAVLVGLYSSLSKCSSYIEATKVELYDGRIVPATFWEEHNSLSSTPGTKLFVTVLPHYRAHYPVQNTCWGSISTHVVLPTKNRMPRSIQEGSTLHRLLFWNYTSSNVLETMKKDQNATILKSPICWRKNASDKDWRTLLP